MIIYTFFKIEQSVVHLSWKLHTFSFIWRFVHAALLEFIYTMLCL